MIMLFVDPCIYFWQSFDLMCIACMLDLLVEVNVWMWTIMMFTSMINNCLDLVAHSYVLASQNECLHGATETIKECLKILTTVYIGI